LVIVHVGFAGITDNPELAIDEDEARMLANAGANVLEQFDLKPDPKTQAIVGLVIAAGTVYGPRAYMISARKAQARAERKANAATGEGVAGVYAATGEPMGTTSFTVDPRQPLN